MTISSRPLFAYLLIALPLTRTAGAADAPADQARPAALEEIIVTAQKKEEKLSDTPLSLTAISSSQIEALGATEFRDIANTVPGLSMTGNGVGENQVNLRGVTTGADVAPTVGIYIDDVPYGSSTPFGNFASLSLDVALFDLDRVEVLRGPQGTLYGASTMGGLIKYVTPLPDTNNYSGTVRSGVSTTHNGGISYDAGGAVNIPLSPGVAAVRVSAFYSHDGGFIDNTALGEEDVNQSKVYGGRADFLLKPAENLSIRLTAFAQNTYRDGAESSDFNLTTGLPILGTYDQQRLLPEPFAEHFTLVSGTVDYDFGPAKLTSVTSFQKANTYVGIDDSSLYVPILASDGLNFGAVGEVQEADTQKITQEMRLAGTGHYLDWLVGGFFTREDTLLAQNVPSYNTDGTLSAFNLATVTVPSQYKEYAGFVTLTGHLTDRLDLTGGLRFAHNAQNESQTGSGLLVGTLPERFESGNVKTYLLDLKYKINDLAMTYFRFATGYRPGGPNLVANGFNGQPLAQPFFSPDTLHSYEAGLKISTPDHRYSLDGALYWINWDNLMVTAESNGVGVVANASSARNKGAELTLTAVPVDALTLLGTFGYIHAVLSADAPDLGGVEGEVLPNTPKYTAALSGDYTFPVAQFQGFAGATYRYVDTRFASFNANPGIPQYTLPSYSAIDLRTGITVKSTRVELYVKNVTDRAGELNAQTILSAAGGPAQVTLLQPRTVGLSVSTKF
jgi:outer membrane receptor protein involved in Fe transport